MTEQKKLNDAIEYLDRVHRPDLADVVRGLMVQPSSKGASEMTNTKQSAEIMDERKAFEAWAESSGRYFDLDCDVNQDGTVLYMHENARYAWAAWMERAVLSAQANDAKAQEDAKLTALKIAGSDLSNIAFNLAQRDGEVLEKHTCIILDSCRKSWDAAIQGMQTGSV